MTEKSTPIDSKDGNDLRTVIPRLDDLRRKCRSVGSRNIEAADMEVRIDSIMNRLQPSETSDPAIDAEPIPYAALARELYALERFFESNGFLSVAKEVAHVERTLESFAQADEPKTTAAETVVDVSSHGTDPERLSDDDAVETEAGPSRWAVPKPVAVVGLISLIAIAVCIAIIVRHQRAEGNTVE